MFKVAARPDDFAGVATAAAVHDRPRRAASFPRPVLAGLNSTPQPVRDLLVAPRRHEMDAIEATGIVDPLDHVEGVLNTVIRIRVETFDQ